MVNKLGLLVESDFEMSQSQEDSQSQASVSTVTTGRRQKNHLRKDLHIHGGKSSDDEESEDGGSQQSPRQDQRVEQDSPQQSLAGSLVFSKGILLKGGSKSLQGLRSLRPQGRRAEHSTLDRGQT